MKTDRTTKLLLALIAAALWMNLLNAWLRPVPVAAQGPAPSGIDFITQTKVINDRLKDVTHSIDTMGKAFTDVAGGTCSNKKI